MHIDREMIHYDGIEIPSIKITPLNTSGAAAIFHGYGGCKEELLGMAWRIAEIGITTCVIDLRGHGENLLNLDHDIISDVEATIEFCRQYGKVASIGHSSGGRFSLLSSADFAIGISPALNQDFSEATKKTLKDLRSYRVHEDSPEMNYDILRKLPVWQPKGIKRTAVIFGSRDNPDIIQSCQKLLPTDTAISFIEGALHSDIFLLEATINCVKNHLIEWFNK